MAKKIKDMAEEPSKKRLGRGLAALIGEMDKPIPMGVVDSQNEPNDSVPVLTDRHVPIEHVKASKNNPRREFKPSDLEDLANSISEHGIVQPILVRPMGENNYELIAGERRWRAAQKAGLYEVPIVIRDVDDRQALELAIIENVQRADLNPVEEALGYQQLMDEHEYKQADLGKVIGKSRSHVANTLRLLKLPTSVRELLAEGTLSSGHARALITLDSPELLARKIVADGLSVRETEQMVNRITNPIDSEKKTGSKATHKKDADTKALENRLSETLGLKVAINHSSKGKGRIMVDYKNLDQLDDLISRLESK